MPKKPTADYHSEKGVKPVSELRRDIVSKDWVLLTPGRSYRPKLFILPKKSVMPSLPIEKCPFENPSKFGNLPPVLVYQNKKGNDWFLQVIPNKFPLVGPGSCDVVKKVGPYQTQDGTGNHEVIILRDHYRHISDYSKEDFRTLLLAYQDRFNSSAVLKCIDYISIFHNYGKEAGASIPHPHSQVLSLPIVPPDVYSSITGSRDYFHNNGRCIHCDMLKYELKDGERIIFENKSAVVITPFVSRSNFEVRVFPKRHEAFFEQVNEKELLDIAEAMLQALSRIRKNLNDPSFNYFLHTAPVIEKLDYGHYHWHFEIFPKMEVYGGFELGTGIDIITVPPEEAARILRKT